MSKKEKCKLPCECGINTIEMEGLLTNLKTKTMEISHLQIQTDYDLQKFDELKTDIRKTVTILSGTIQDTEANCNLDLNDLKSVNASMEKWAEKENWYVLTRLIDNMSELFTDSLQGQCYELKKQ